MHVVGFVMSQMQISKLLRLSICICLVMAMAILFASTPIQAQTVPQSIMQLHLLDCASPCWVGIIPGLTTVKEAKAKIRAVYGVQKDLAIKDSMMSYGSAGYDGYVSMEIESDNFYLFIRLDIPNFIDANSDSESQIVKSIGLFESRSDRNSYAPDVADILNTLGAPQAVATAELMSGSYEVVLRYKGMYVFFDVYTDQIELTEIPYIYLSIPEIQPMYLPSSLEYRPWKGRSSLTIPQVF